MHPLSASLLGHIKAAPLVSPPSASAPARQHVIVPRELWPRYSCSEHDGVGWSAEVISEQNGRLVVRFLHARTMDGRTWPTHSLRSGAVIRVGTDGLPLADLFVAPNTHSLRLASLSLIDIPAPFAVSALGMPLSRQEELTTSLQRDCALVDPVFSADMHLLSHAAGAPPGCKLVMVSVAGVPAWWPLPTTAKGAFALVNGEQWKKAMWAFVDKTRGVDGFLPVSRKLTKDKNKARLSWVFKYSKGDDGMPVEHARLVYNHSAKNGEIFQELSYSNVCKPLHWKAFLHASIVDGATLYRRDIVNAHQSVRRGPDLEPAYSYGIPGIDLLDEEGQPADLLWLNYLNGMPPVGAAFAEDLKSHFVAFGLRRLITDDYVHCRFDNPSSPSTDYIKVCLIVDGVTRVQHYDNREARE